MTENALSLGSYWGSTVTNPMSYPALESDLNVDVVVIGAGIVGLTVAERLCREGKTVVVLEALRIGTQVTGRSTAKVTSQHGLFYSGLIDAVGEDNARLYAEVNEAAIGDIEQLVTSENIACGFERKPAYIYTPNSAGVAAIEAEVGAAVRLGLPAHLTKDIQAGIHVETALCFDEQAQLNPVQFLHGLAAVVARKASVFEMTRVTDVKHGEPCRVSTATGATVTARDVIVSTHQPVVPDGKFFAKAFPFSHSVVAAPLDEKYPLGGMCITSGEPSFSFRDDSSGGQRHVIAVGPTFKTGVTEEEVASFDQLERFLQETFGVDAPTYRWTNEDFAPMDGLPFVGRASSGSPHFFVAVGFNAWGITTGTVAATLIADLIMDRPSRCAELFDASRIRPLKGGAQFIKGNMESAKHFIADRYGLPKQISDLAKGQATLARVNDETVAAYCDDAGTLHTVAAACTHMGCLVGWNQTDKSWDCPCHGSRFATDGSVLHGPATAPLKKLTGMI